MPLRLLLLTFGVLIGACAGLPPTLTAAASTSGEPTRVQPEVMKALDREAAGKLLARHVKQTDALFDAPLTTGNRVRLLVDGPVTLKAMFDAISRAREHIDLEAYIIESEGPGAELAQLLARKRAQGVRVRVLYDSVGSNATPKEYFEQLKTANIAVCEFNPVNPLKAKKGWQINNRDHRKLLIVDGRVAFTGGINFSSTYSASSSPLGRQSGPSRAGALADPKHNGWRDTHVEVRGPVVPQFERLFAESWEAQHCEPAAAPAKAQRAAVSRTPAAGDKAARVVKSDPESKQSETYVALLSAIKQAERRVWLTNGYFVPDPQLMEVLKEAAGRGVDVRLVLPGLSDFWAPLYAGRSSYQALLSAGVHLFERKDALLHAKSAVIDGVWSAIGSTNLDWRSFVHNYEADLIVLDREFGQEMEALFQRDAQNASPIDPAQWARRGPVERLKEWFARRWQYLL